MSDLKYFARWIPVKGDSNFVQCWGKTICKRSSSNSALYYLIDNEEGEPPITDFEVKNIPHGFKHVKLFLCSRDIWVGDQIKSLQDERTLLVDSIDRNDKHTIYYNKEKVWFSELDALKVIGEINYTDNWVTEGDEFKVSELYIKGTEPDNYHCLELILQLDGVEPKNETYYLYGSDGKYH